MLRTDFIDYLNYRLTTNTLGKKDAEFIAKYIKYKVSQDVDPNEILQAMWVRSRSLQPIPLNYVIEELTQEFIPVAVLKNNIPVKWI
jgi:hypothetical protein